MSVEPEKGGHLEMNLRGKKGSASGSATQSLQLLPKQEFRKQGVLLSSKPRGFGGPIYTPTSV